MDGGCRDRSPRHCRRSAPPQEMASPVVSWSPISAAASKLCCRASGCAAARGRDRVVAFGERTRLCALRGLGQPPRHQAGRARRLPLARESGAFRQGCNLAPATRFIWARDCAHSVDVDNLAGGFDPGNSRLQRCVISSQKIQDREGRHDGIRGPGPAFLPWGDLADPQNASGATGSLCAPGVPQTRLR